MNDEAKDFLTRAYEAMKPVIEDGQEKRKTTKPPWYIDDHEPGLFSHIARYKKGEMADPDSGAHPLVHCAVRCLMIALTETGNVPHAPVD